MRRLARFTSSITIAITLAACAYPDFQFGTDAGPEAPRVPCGVSGALCAPGELCCFDRVGTNDTCASPGGCPSGHSELYCNVTAACPEGFVCCASFASSLAIPDVMECRSTCTGSDAHLACESDQDCGGGACVDMYPDYPGYKVCF